MYPSREHRHGFSLIELIVVIAIVGILAALILPAVQLVKAAALTTRCASNLRQISLAANAWSVDHDNTVVPNKKDPEYGMWFQAIAPYLDEEQRIDTNLHSSTTVLRGCPTWEQTRYRQADTGWFEWANIGYGETIYAAPGSPWPGRACLYGDWAPARVSNSMISQPTVHPWFGDCAGSVFEMAWYTDPSAMDRHRGRMNVLYFDSHIATSTYGEVRAWQDAMWNSP